MIPWRQLYNFLTLTSIHDQPTIRVDNDTRTRLGRVWCTGRCGRSRRTRDVISGKTHLVLNKTRGPRPSGFSCRRTMWLSLRWLRRRQMCNFKDIRPWDGVIGKIWNDAATGISFYSIQRQNVVILFFWPWYGRWGSRYGALSANEKDRKDYSH